MRRREKGGEGERERDWRRFEREEGVGEVQKPSRALQDSKFYLSHPVMLHLPPTPLFG